jgi:hypothetical protein
VNGDPSKGNNTDFRKRKKGAPPRGELLAVGKKRSRWEWGNVGGSLQVTLKEKEGKRILRKKPMERHNIHEILNAE